MPTHGGNDVIVKARFCRSTQKPRDAGEEDTFEFIKTLLLIITLSPSRFLSAVCVVEGGVL